MRKALKTAAVAPRNVNILIMLSALGAHVNTLQSPTAESFWIGYLTHGGGTDLKAWVFAQANSQDTGRVYLSPENTLLPHLDILPRPDGSHRLAGFGEMEADYTVEASNDFRQGWQVGTLPLPGGSIRGNCG